MEDLVKIEDQYYIRANSALAEEKTHVLKRGEIFAIFTQEGNIRPLGFENHGLYFEGTRFLSRYLLNVEKKHPLLLSSTVKKENEFMAIDLTNPDIGKGSKLIAKGSLHIFRAYFLSENILYERIRLSNFSLGPIEIKISLEFDADFRDIFEVRGMTRKSRGRLLDPIVTQDRVELIYEGLDKVLRKTYFLFTPHPVFVDGTSAGFKVYLEPRQDKDIFVEIGCQAGQKKPSFHSYSPALKTLDKYQSNICKDRSYVNTSNELFNDWLGRSMADLFMMLTQTEYGLYPYAGIPWFSTVFGRDGLITALESLWIYPKIAEGVLRYLSNYQSQALCLECDGEPGKILHEVRKGEMAALKEIPFGKYYGSIDSTLLYLILAGHYYRRSANLLFIKEIWPQLMAALKWTYEYGDRDKDGFIEYERKSIGGLSQQGWKDSEDSIFHKDGNLAKPPIALCEVQAYLYEAKIQMAELARALGETKISRKLLEESVTLKKNFIKKFWCDDIGMLVIALDGEKRQCKIRSSNAGQCLFSNIVPVPKAKKIHKQLMSEDFFSGWGIRTVSSSQIRYNPMSYHNGSVWPHDNALIAYGLNRYGYKDSVIRIMAGLFDASTFMSLNRLPELFCGFHKRPQEGPTLYPTACEPQSWSSACVYMLLQSVLGLHIDAPKNKIYFIKPALPCYLKEVRINNLEIGRARLDIGIKAHPKSIEIKEVKRKGKIELVVVR